jgi:uncharacterized protein YgiM (DUF1202 family)
MQALKINFLNFWSSSRIIRVVLFCLLATSHASGQLLTSDQVVTLVNSFKVRVRATPQILPDNILASLFKGTQLPMTGSENGWYRVTLPDGQTGWVHGDYGKVEQARDQLEVVYEVVRVRAQPTTESDSQARAVMGQRFHLLEKVNDWYRVQIPNETEGWVREDMVILRPVFSNSPEEHRPTLPAPDKGTLSTQQIKAQKETEASENSQEIMTPETNLSREEKDAIDLEADTSLQSEVSVPPPLPSSSTHAPEHPGVLTEVGVDWLTIAVVAAFLTLLALAIFAILRQRRMTSISQVVKRGRSKTTEPERTLVREMNEAQNKLDSLERKIHERFTDFRAVTGDSTALSSKTSEDLLTSLDDLRTVIQDQQKRMDLYSELVSLQNDQIEALKQENSSIKMLLELKDGA